MDETKSRDSEKQGTPKRKAEGSKLLEPAGMWTKHGVVQRQESRTTAPRSLYSTLAFS